MLIKMRRRSEGEVDDEEEGSQKEVVAAVIDQVVSGRLVSELYRELMAMMIQPYDSLQEK